MRRSRRSVLLSPLGTSSRRLCPFCLRVHCCDGSDRVSSYHPAAWNPLARILLRRKTSSSAKLPKVASTSADGAPLASQIAASDSDLTAVSAGERKATQARPTEAEQVAEQQKDAADLLTKHRTTARFSAQEPCMARGASRQTRRLLQRHSWKQIRLR